MPKLSDRIDRLEKLDPYRGRRPPEMTIEQFTMHWRQMKPDQFRSYLRTIPDQDLEEGLVYLQSVVDSEEGQHHGNTKTAS